ncbi:MAG: NupC/NupG family nucleoside CNT transporter [Gemmatimonadota bacterium]|jgi:CNT family concentrative nucleoside transporter|nr:NupC/NupG family nucleoside CNT transporter [Gemmatimonadota bacterium]
MAFSKTRLKRVLPLWLAAGLLLAAGWTSHAQESPPAVPTDTATGTSPNPLAEAPARDPASGVLEPAQPGLQPGGAVTAAQRARLARNEARGGTPTEKATSLLGLLVFVGVAWLLSVNRRAVQWRVVIWGLGLQLAFAALILLTAPGRAFFEWLNDVFVALLGYTNEGASFLFGNLIRPNVPVGPSDGPFGSVAAAESWANTGALFAFSVLPTIIFFSSLMTLLYYLGIMQIFVKAFAWLMLRTMGTSGAESLSAAGNIFVGQTEAPLLVKPFVRTMTNSELHAVMTGGFATVAGGVLAAYVGMLVAFFPDIAGHLIAASVMSAPAALAISKIMHPETEESVTKGKIRIELENTDANAIDAAARGASEGLGLALNVGAMLLAFIALLALLNGLVGWAAGLFGLELTIQTILGWLGAPVAWLMGTPWQDAQQVGVLLGEKIALNEFVAYLHLANMLQGGEDLSARAVVIATYALCGFANFSSIAIQIGGIGGLAPERRGDLSRMGLRAMIGGTLAAFMTACVVGILI